MLPLVVSALGLLATADAVQAQQCLHTRLETAEDRLRRDRAIEFVRRVNAAQAMPTSRGPRYRALEELPFVPPVPDGFEVQFHTDGRSYALSLKDRRDPCRFAVFSDQEGAVYAAVPQPSRPMTIPVESPQARHWRAVCSVMGTMPERFSDDPMRELIDQIDARLREAERVRNKADEQYRDRPFWPERRRSRRSSDPDDPNEPNSPKAT
jgi:hypothetical protein